MFLLLNSKGGFTGVSRVFGRQINPDDPQEDEDHYNERNGGRGTTSSGSREQNRENESSSHTNQASTSSSSGETLERRGKKVWRIEDDGGTRGYVKPWSR